MNGSLIEWFSLRKGLQQGDPLAPYIPIQGTEILIRSIKVVVAFFSITCFQMARGSFLISQLNFVDYCILLFKANIVKASFIKDILLKCCECKGTREL